VGYAGGEVRAVPRGREVTYPRFVGLSLTDIESAAERRTLLFCAPGAATAELLVRSDAGTTRVVARARLSADGIGQTTAPMPIADLLERDGHNLLVVVRDAAGRNLERVPAPAGHTLQSELLDGPVYGPTDGG
jgi:hypothetical protein